MASGLETTAYYALGIPMFAAVIGFERWVGRRRGVELFGFAETLSNLSAGLGTLLVGVLTGPWILAAYDAVQTRFAVVHWGPGSLWRWPFALLACDLCYYVYHRAGHRFGGLWAIHGIHHQHERLNSTVGLRLEWFADVSTVVFFAPLPLLGIDSTCFFLTIAALSAYTLTAHSPAFARPTWGVFVTPATHGSHHSRDSRYIDCNYGAMFSFWDRLAGTWNEPPPGDVLRSDLPTVCRVHDGVSTQWSLLRELAADVWGAPDLGTRLALVGGRPALTATRITGVPRDDAAIAPADRAWVLARFLAIALVGTWLLWWRDAQPLPVLVLGVAVVIWGLRAVGGLLDGRPGAAREDAAQLVAMIAFLLVATR
jgi:sterol desaturase/sphingolipid hydroxylase (fatty acid hydroxylase superfamily)